MEKYPKVFHILSLFALLFMFAPVFVSAHIDSDSHTVEITKTGFLPNEITIEVGETVTFVNKDTGLHWPASNLHPTHTIYPGSDIRKCGTEDQSVILDSCRGLEQGETYGFTFNEAGRWRFHDHLNSGFNGEVAVRTVGDVSTVETPPNKKAESVTRIGTNLKVSLFKGFFRIFPGTSSRIFSNLNMFEVAKNDKRLEFWMRVVGYERVLNEVEIDSKDLAINSEESRGQCHTEAHYVGRLANKLFGISALTEEKIESRCQFGFYHGVMEASLGNLAEDDVVMKISGTCASYTEKNPVRRIFCEHAIGHGLLVHYGYDLPMALKKCSLVRPGAAIGLCYHGVYMENAFAELGIGVEHQTPWVDDDLPDFPCTSELVKNQPGAMEHCYFSQSLLWAAPFDEFDADASINGCLRAPEGVRELCFIGFGFSASSPQASMSNEDISATCGKAPKIGDKNNCLVGAIFMRSVIWESSVDFDSQPLCLALKIDGGTCSSYVKRKLAWVFER